MKTAVALAATFLWLVIAVGPVQAQETTAEPNPTVSAPGQTKGTPPPETQKPAAPVERRASKPTAGSPGQVAGPLTKTGAAQAGSQTSEQPVNRGGEVETIKVRTRLVNVALNVVDAHGSPVGGFEKKDFQLFEDGKPQTIAVFEREATSPLSIVLAIDESGTVETSERLERQAAKNFVRAILREQDELGLDGLLRYGARELFRLRIRRSLLSKGLASCSAGTRRHCITRSTWLASGSVAEWGQPINGACW